MRKWFLTLGFLVLNFFCLNVFAQPLVSKDHPNATGTSSIMPTLATESVDDLKTELAIYSLIAGVYALYWWKQRA